jgi:hypothetical protein
MGHIDRIKRQRTASAQAGKPLGGGLDEREVALGGCASLSDLSIRKPVERDGKRGLAVGFVVHAEGLGGRKLAVETTLHAQGLGPLRSRALFCADALGNLERVEVYTPADDDAASAEREAFFPFSAIDVEREGSLRCFARVRILEADRGNLAVEEVAFEFQAS